MRVTRACEEVINFIAADPRLDDMTAFRRSVAASEPMAELALPEKSAFYCPLCRSDLLDRLRPKSRARAVLIAS
jgi:hypothetical protein